MYYWDLNWIGMMLFDRKVSVVVRRMYYWDPLGSPGMCCPSKVSVVVRRVYYWDLKGILGGVLDVEFQ